jgi:hypothetical protein
MDILRSYHFVLVLVIFFFTKLILAKQISVFGSLLATRSLPIKVHQEKKKRNPTNGFIMGFSLPAAVCM